VFYIAAIISTGFFFLSFGLKESRATYILQKQVTKLRLKTGHTTLKIYNPDSYPTVREFVRGALGRPLYFLATEPIVLLCSVLNAIAFGLIYGLTEVIPIVYMAFGFSARDSSLAFIPVLIGVWISGLPRLYDHLRIARLQSQNRPIAPETKIHSFAIAVPALAIGLWWFAWSIPPKVSHISWIVSMIGLVPIGFAANDIDAVLGGYLVDSYETYAASAFSALALTRSVISALFSLISALMFQRLDNNIAGTVLAGIATAFCVSPLILLKFGKKLREKSNFASSSKGLELGSRSVSTESSGFSSAETAAEEEVC